MWRITSNADQTSNTKTVFAEILNTDLEGVVSLPNDQQKYGPWAGKIVTGAERRLPVPFIYTIDTNGNVADFAEGIAPEDFDIIPAGQALYCNDGEGEGRYTRSRQRTSANASVIFSSPKPVRCGTTQRCYWSFIGMEVIS